MPDTIQTAKGIRRINRIGDRATVIGQTSIPRTSLSHVNSVWSTYFHSDSKTEILGTVTEASLAKFMMDRAIAAVEVATEHVSRHRPTQKDRANTAKEGSSDSDMSGDNYLSRASLPSKIQCVMSLSLHSNCFKDSESVETTPSCYAR